MTTKAKERPILFSGPMVRAILDGRKTQTRRVVTVRNSCRQAAPQRWFYDLSRAWRDPGFPQLQGGLKAEYLHVPFCNPEDGWEEKPIDDTVERWYSLWQPGDRLWVRETWRAFEPKTRILGGNSVLANAQMRVYARNPVEGESVIEYAADFDKRTASWRPSIHMPRWASRILLEVTNVRVEQVQEITVTDALKEGIAYDLSKPDGGPFARFRSLWDSINAKRGYGWKENPWVWVVEFRRIEP